MRDCKEGHERRENVAGEKGVVEEMRKRGQRMDGLSEDKKRGRHREGGNAGETVNRRYRTLLSALAKTRENADICTLANSEKGGKEGETREGERGRRGKRGAAPQNSLCTGFRGAVLQKSICVKRAFFL